MTTGWATLMQAYQERIAGALLREVVLPRDFDPKHIEDDFFLGVWRDALEVEDVQLYDLIKPWGRTWPPRHSPLLWQDDLDVEHALVSELIEPRGPLS